MKQASQAVRDEGVAAADIVGRDEHITPAPRVSVQAFCETVETAAAIQAAGEDRCLAKTHLRIQMGGLPAAIEAYQSAPTPNVIIIESESRGEAVLAGLDRLAEVCDAGSRVVVIGRMNDVGFYRGLVGRGVSDYLIAPVGSLQVVRAVCGLFTAPDAEPVGRIIAVVGAKGGVGASTVAHNIAFAIGPISISLSGPPVSISTRIRRRALPRRCSRPIVSTMPSLIDCCRNAPII